MQKCKHCFYQILDEIVRIKKILQVYQKFGVLIDKDSILKYLPPN